MVNHDQKVNIFIIGDLVIDHTIFVQNPTVQHQPIDAEKIFEVVRRQNTAGGAANSARILAVLSPGTTYLWGVLGRSPWGEYRDILSESHSLDGATGSVELRGIRDETEASMNTITRIVRIDSPSFRRRSHEARFDDYGSIHVSERKRKTVFHYLNRAVAKLGQLHAIILNDLDMNTLSRELVKEIEAYAESKGVPLIVDPKRDASKYVDCRGLAFMPNLREWCTLVGDKEDDKYEIWRRMIYNREGRQLIARRSFECFPGFTYHVIKCDKDGALLIGPDQEDPYRHLSATLLPPEGTPPAISEEQIGCGDIMAAVLALSVAGKENPSASEILHGLRMASLVIARYRTMPWARMPPVSSLAEVERSAASRRPSSRAPERVTLSRSFTYLPTGRLVDLSRYGTRVPGILTSNAEYRRMVDGAVKTLDPGDSDSGWATTPLRGVILTGPGGNGKSEIATNLQCIGDEGTIVRWVAGDEFRTLTDTTLPAFVERRLAGKPGASRVILIVDEAAKAAVGNHLVKNGVRLLIKAAEMRLRFVFIDADFPILLEKRRLDQQFTSRCEIFPLTDLSSRPQDAIWITANLAMTTLRCSSIAITRGCLLAILDAVLEGLTTRDLCADIKRACINAEGRSGERRLSHADLEKVPGGVAPDDESWTFTFVR